MRQGQSRTIGKRKTPGQLHTKSPGKTRGKRIDLIHMREKVFELKPLQLNAFISLGDYLPSREALDVTSEPEMEETLDLETELEVTDEDDDFEEERGGDTATLDYVTHLGATSEFGDTATLLTNSVYAITVAPATNGRNRCWFEGPGWFEGRMPPEMRVYVSKLKNFLDAMAGWLADEKQEFLEKPCPENFVFGEAEFIEHPVIQQKGFVRRINGQLLSTFPFTTKEEYEKKSMKQGGGNTWPIWPEVDETQFSRLLDKIWLLWPQWNMPLAALFSPAYRLAWLVEVCARDYSEAGGQWLKPELNYPDFGDHDLDIIKRKQFSTLTPEEKLHLLRARLQGGKAMAELALRLICERVAAEQRGGAHAAES